MFFPCLLRSRPRRPLPGASETAWDRCSGGTGSESRIPGAACKEGSRQGIAPAAGSGAGMGFGGGDSLSRDMENRTASAPPTACPEGPGKSRHLRPAWETLGCSRLGFPSSYSIFSSKAYEGCRESTSQGCSGKCLPWVCRSRPSLPQGHLCTLSVGLELASLHCLDISPGAVWLGLFPSHVLAPKDIRIPLFIPMSLWGHPSAGLGSKPSSR